DVDRVRDGGSTQTCQCHGPTVRRLTIKRARDPRLAPQRLFVSPDAQPHKKQNSSRRAAQLGVTRPHDGIHRPLTEFARSKGEDLTTLKLLSVAFRLIHTRSRFITVCLMANLAAVAPAKDQSGAETTQRAAPAASVVQQQDDDVLNPAEPDFVVVNLPTTLRLPLFQSNFRLTHRVSGTCRQR